MKSYSINNPFNSKLYREALHRRKSGGAAYNKSETLMFINFWMPLF